MMLTSSGKYSQSLLAPHLSQLTPHLHFRPVGGPVWERIPIRAQHQQVQHDEQRQEAPPKLQQQHHDNSPLQRQGPSFPPAAKDLLQRSQLQEFRNRSGEEASVEAKESEKKSRLGMSSSEKPDPSERRPLRPSPELRASPLQSVPSANSVFVGRGLRCEVSSHARTATSTAASKAAAPAAAARLPTAPPRLRVQPKARPPSPVQQPPAGDGEDSSRTQLGPRVLKAMEPFPGYQGEMPPEEAEERWTDHELHAYFFSSGFIKPKRPATGLKRVSPALLEQYYRVLGLKLGARASCARKAYRQLALRFHPDKNLDSPEATRKFQEITEAYAAVCNQLELAQTKG
ncbi:unnamed protein product [Polarella glacialis]|uniref:J domain-containing protein n=1 Tax=Polarella glacialis TaxID=89957 RepID=A0A813GYH5_POLGL|nr:unnamed protein product [Polarella glacialis]